MNKLDNEIIKLKEQKDIMQDFGDNFKVECYNQKLKGLELGIKLAGKLKQIDLCKHLKIIPSDEGEEL